MKNLLPIHQANGNLLNKETGELAAINYLPGYPRQYRFDASRGNFNVKGETPVTKKGETLVILPIAYRIFRDDILGYGMKKWAEFFFLNESHQVCSLLLHGYSVENLMRIVDDLYYDGVNLCQVALSIKPVEKQSKAPGAEGNKYFIAEFSFKPLDADSLASLEAISQTLPLWREETLTGDAEVQYALNYNPPIKAEHKELEAPKPEVQDLAA